MSMEPTEKEMDAMVEQEIEFAVIEARKTPREKLLDALERQQRIMDNIKNIVEKLGKI